MASVRDDGPQKNTFGQLLDLRSDFHHFGGLRWIHVLDINISADVAHRLPSGGEAVEGHRGNSTQGG